MKRLRRFVRSSERGGLLAVYIAYSLALQPMMGSVGLGMSVGVAADQASHILCSSAADQTANAPARERDRHKTNPVPQCPFCFIAAQSVGLVATTSEAPTFPAFAGSLIGAISERVGDRTFVRQLRHTNGEPRAPPAFPV
jgi:hypothetical protein